MCRRPAECVTEAGVARRLRLPRLGSGSILWLDRRLMLAGSGCWRPLRSYVPATCAAILAITGKTGIRSRKNAGEHADVPLHPLARIRSTGAGFRSTSVTVSRADFIKLLEPVLRGFGPRRWVCGCVVRYGKKSDEFCSWHSENLHPAQDMSSFRMRGLAKLNDNRWSDPA